MQPQPIRTICSHTKIDVTQCLQLCVGKLCRPTTVISLQLIWNDHPTVELAQRNLQLIVFQILQIAIELIHQLLQRAALATARCIDEGGAVRLPSIHLPLGNAVEVLHQRYHIGHAVGSIRAIVERTDHLSLRCTLSTEQQIFQGRIADRGDGIDSRIHITGHHLAVDDVGVGRECVDHITKRLPVDNAWPIGKGRHLLKHLVGSEERDAQLHQILGIGLRSEIIGHADKHLRGKVPFFELRDDDPIGIVGAHGRSIKIAVHSIATIRITRGSCEGNEAEKK